MRPFTLLGAAIASILSLQTANAVTIDPGTVPGTNNSTGTTVPVGFGSNTGTGGHVTVAWSTAGSSHWSTWATWNAAASGMAYVGSPGGAETITFTAAAGYTVSLASFQAADFTGTSDAFTTLSVAGDPTLGTWNGALTAPSNTNYTNYSPGRTSAVGGTLTLTWQITNGANSGNVGIDNIVFTETLAVAPEPASVGLVIAGSAAMMLRRRRR